MPVPPPKQRARQRFGNYELLSSLATGGTAEVFLARLRGESGFQKLVIVKRLLDSLVKDEDFVRMFLDEARLGARLEHSNVVQTIDLGEVDHRYFIALEYIAGLTLADLVALAQERVPGGLPPDATVGIISQACAGLHYAHELSLPDGTRLCIVHRDVSPQNLMLTFEGVVKVLDFGVAHAQAVRESKTEGGMIKGKFAYMSPEQCLGEPLDRRTDVFALGIIAHELLTGQRLFKRDTLYQTYQAITSGAPIPPPSTMKRGLDRELDPIVMRALAFKASDRYTTAEEMGDAFERYLRRRGVSVGQSVLARFLEQHFTPELVAHEQRVRAALGDEAGADDDGEPPTALDSPPFPLPAEMPPARGRGAPAAPTTAASARGKGPLRGAVSVASTPTVDLGAGVKLARPTGGSGAAPAAPAAPEADATRPMAIEPPPDGGGGAIHYAVQPTAPPRVDGLGGAGGGAPYAVQPTAPPRADRLGVAGGEAPYAVQPTAPPPPMWPGAAASSAAAKRPIAWRPILAVIVVLELAIAGLLLWTGLRG